MERKLYKVCLTIEEREELEKIVNKGKGSVFRVKHAQILLSSDENGNKRKTEEIAACIGCNKDTVVEVRKRYVEQGLQAALERKKRETGARPRVLDGEGEARLVAIACQKPPSGRANWTLQLLADRLVELEIVPSISHQTVHRTLKKTNSSLTYGNAGSSRPTRMPIS